MRVALLASEPLDVAARSGTAVAVQGLRDALASRGAVLEAVTPAHRSRAGLAVTAWRFNRALRRRDLSAYDAVLGLGGDGRTVARRLPQPFVALVKALYADVLPHECGTTRAMLALLARWEAAAAVAAGSVAVPSAYAASAVRRLYGVDASRLRVIPEPFDLDAWRALLPAPAREGRRVLCVAHLYPRKRVRDLVAAWPSVRARVPGAELEIVGAGPELAALRRAAAGVAGCSVPGGLRHGAEVAGAYARADLFCLPSAQETFGIAAVEAMASGLPLVVAAGGALPETVSGAVVEVVPPGNPEALAAAVARGLDGENRARAASVNPGLTRAFAPERVASLMLEAMAAAGR